METTNFFGKKFFLIIIVAISIYSIFIFYSDVNLVYEKLLDFNFSYLPIILTLIFVSWLFLFFRWNILLKNSNIHIPLKDNFLIYFAGFALSVSPGKSGELIKVILLKNKFNINKTTSISIIFVERFYDIIGAVIVTMLGLGYLGIEFLPAIGIAIFLIAFVLFSIYSKTCFNLLIKIMSNFKFLKKFTISAKNSHDVIKNSSSFKIGIFSSLLTVIYRLIESLAVYFVLLGFGIDIIPYIALTATYSSSIILGAVTMIPGGLGVTEASLAGLLSLQNIAIGTALVLAIVIRFFTTWYGVIVGFIALKLSRGLKQDDGKFIKTNK
mgnify:CR=1 FL=1|jgi:glycosyltransferase 2 family protein